MKYCTIVCIDVFGSRVRNRWHLSELGRSVGRVVQDSSNDQGALPCTTFSYARFNTAYSWTMTVLGFDMQRVAREMKHNGILEWMAFVPPRAKYY